MPQVPRSYVRGRSVLRSLPDSATERGGGLVLNRKQESGSAAHDPLSLALPQPYLLFLGDTVEPGYAKTAFGLRDWASDKCVGEFALPSATVSTGLALMSPSEAHAAGAKS